MKSFFKLSIIYIVAVVGYAVFISRFTIPVFCARYLQYIY